MTVQMKLRVRAWRRVGVSAALAVGLLLTAGCADFFPPLTSTTTTSSSNTGDYVYVVNSVTNSLYEYVVGSSVLTAISGSPVTLQSGLAARSVVVTPGNGFVYVGGNGGIYCYSIGTAGALTAVTAGNVQATANFVSLTASIDGKWLLGLDSGLLTGLPAVYVYGVNTSTGVLTLSTTVQVASPSASANPAPTVVANTIAISRNNGVVAVTLGTAGAVVYAFNDTTGALVSSSSSPTGVYNSSTAYSYNGVLFDVNSAYVYFSQTAISGSGSGVVGYPVTGLGVLGTQLTLAATGGGPAPLVEDATGTYLYAGNRTDGTVTGYTVASGALTALASSPYSSSPGITAMTRDNGTKYIVGVGSGGGNDVTLYALDAITPGKLDALAVVSTGATGSTAVAATHVSGGS